MSTTTIRKHTYVLDADETIRATKAIAWRLSKLPEGDPIYHSGAPIETAGMLGHALEQVCAGVLDRLGNVIVSRTLYLYADHAGRDHVRTTEATITAERLFRERMVVDKSTGEWKSA